MWLDVTNWLMYWTISISKVERMFVTELAGSIYSTGLDGSNKKLLLATQGNLIGVAYVEDRTRAH